MGDPRVVDAVYQLGMETDWEADVVDSDDRLLIILNMTVVGEIQGDGTRVIYPEDQQVPFKVEEG